jgi:hypothetical protein
MFRNSQLIIFEEVHETLGFMHGCVCVIERETERQTDRVQGDELRYVTYIRCDEIRDFEKINAHSAMRCDMFNVSSRCFPYAFTSHITGFLLISALPIMVISTQSHKYLHHLTFLFQFSISLLRHFVSLHMHSLSALICFKQNLHFSSHIYSCYPVA